MTTKKVYPKALRNDPIIEAMFEVRFKPTVVGVADLLPGALYPLLKGQYERVEIRPMGEMPKSVRDQIPNSSYQATKSLVGKGTHLNIAERAVTVVVLKPYWGWEKFRPLIFDTITAIQTTNLIGEIERTSLRYQNLLTTHNNPNDFSGLNLEIALADYKLRDGGFRLRAEVERSECISVIQVAGSAQAVTGPEDKKVATTGLLLDIDTIKFAPMENFWTEFREIVENIHEAEKDIFFGMLKAETLEKLDPVWE